MPDCSMQGIYVTGVVKSRTSVVLRSTITRCALPTSFDTHMQYSRHIADSGAHLTWSQRASHHTTSTRFCGPRASRASLEVLAVVTVALRTGVPVEEALSALFSVSVAPLYTSPSIRQ
jgi:hypothetical protein